VGGRQYPSLGEFVIGQVGDFDVLVANTLKAVIVGYDQLPVLCQADVQFNSITCVDGPLESREGVFRVILGIVEQTAVGDVLTFEFSHRPLSGPDHLRT